MKGRRAPQQQTLIVFIAPSYLSINVTAAQPVRHTTWPHRVVSLRSRLAAQVAHSSNDKHLIQGQLDVPLNELGKR